MIEFAASLFNLQMLAAPEAIEENGAEAPISGSFAKLLAISSEVPAGAKAQMPLQPGPAEIQPPAATGIATGNPDGKILPVKTMPFEKQPTQRNEAGSESLVPSEDTTSVAVESAESLAPLAMPIQIALPAPAAFSAPLAPPSQSAQSLPHIPAVPTASLAPPVVATPVAVPVTDRHQAQSKHPVAPRQIGQAIRQAPRSIAVAPVRSELPSLPGQQSTNENAPGAPIDLPVATAAKAISPLEARSIQLPVISPQAIVAPGAEIVIRQHSAAGQPMADASRPLSLVVAPLPAASPQASELAPLPAYTIAQAITLAIPSTIANIIPAALHPRAISTSPEAQATPMPQPAPVELLSLAPVAVQAAIPAAVAKAQPARLVPPQEAAQSGVEASPIPLEKGIQLPLHTEAVPPPADSRTATPVALQQVSETSPAPPPATQPQRPEAPRDFTALIDRLVEARDAARSTIVPQAVQAAIAHSEFGKVDLRFEQSAGQLSISLASADPEFARAVQAAAPPFQQELPRENQSAQHRQDSFERQPSGGNLTQSQSQQQRGQNAEPRSEQPRSQPESGPQRGSDTRSHRRNGIFA